MDSKTGKQAEFQRQAEQSFNASHLPEKFTVLIRACDEMTLVPSQRERLQNQLGYFKIQADLPSNRRDSDRLRFTNWRKLLLDQKSETLLARFRVNLNFWLEVSRFVGEDSATEKRQAPVKDDKSMTPKSPAEQDRADRLSPKLEDFFDQLFRSAERAIPSAQKTNKLLVGVSLQYLKLESRQKPEDRNAKFLRQTWQSIWPILNGLHLLDSYKEDFALKAKLQSFIANSFVGEPEDHTKTKRVSPFDRVSTKTAARAKPYLVSNAPVSRPKPKVPRP